MARVSRRRRQRSTAAAGEVPDPPTVAAATAEKGDGAADPVATVSDETKPKAQRLAAWARMVRSGAGMARDFIADSRIAERFKEAAHRPQGMQLWSEFTAQTALRIRGMRPTADTTLDGLMLMLTDATKPDPRAPRKADLRRLCDATCHYVHGRRLNAEACRRDPERVVSLCSPDPTSGGECAMTLCFDAEELAAELAAFRRSGASHMRNPALVDPALNPVLLQTELDGDTVEMLEWQVSLWRERRALKRATITGSDRSILTSFVLPALTVALAEMGERTWFGRLWKRYTPQRLKRFLAGLGNWMLLLLTDPLLSTLLFFVTKSLRVLFCLLQFDRFDYDQWIHLMWTWLETVSPLEHFPVITLILRAVADMCECIRDVASLGVLKCLDRVFAADGSVWTGFDTLRKVLWSTSKEFIRRFVPVLNGVSELVKDTFNLTPYKTAGTIVRWLTWGFIQLQSDDDTNADIQTIHFRKLMKQLYDDSRTIYTMKQFSVSVGLFLMFARRVTAARFVEVLREMANAALPLRPLGALIGAMHDAFEAAFPGSLDTLHAMFMWAMRIPSFHQTIELALTLTWEIWWLVRCGWYAGWHTLGAAMGLNLVLPQTRDASCCLEGLRNDMKDVLKSMDEEHDKVNNSCTVEGPGGIQMKVDCETLKNVAHDGPIILGPNGEHGEIDTAEDDGPGVFGGGLFGWGYRKIWGSRKSTAAVDTAGLHNAPVDQRLTVQRERLRGHPMERAYGLPWYRWRWKQPESRVLYDLEGWAEGPLAPAVRRRFPRGEGLRRDAHGYDRLDWLAIQRMNQCTGRRSGSTWLGRLRERRGRARRP